MASQLDIYNEALLLIGNDPVSDVTEADADPIHKIYELERDALLSDHPWNFNDTRLTVATTGVTPAYEYTYEYLLPAGGTQAKCLRLWEVDNDPKREFKVVAGRKIWTDAGSPLKIRYSALVTETGTYDPMFVSALAARLAWKTAWKFTDSRTRVLDLRAEARDALAAARSADGREGTAQFSATDDFLEARI